MAKKKIAALVDGRQDVPNPGDDYSAASKQIKEVADTDLALTAQDTWATNVRSVRQYVQSVLSGGVEFKGVWDAATNNPALSSGVGTTGDLYRVSVAGNTNLDGITDWKVGDSLLFDGTQWWRIANEDQVVSVAGKIGAVILDAADITDFDTEVSNNTSVAANTAARHTQNTDIMLDMGNPNQVTAAEIRAHIDDADKHRLINDVGNASTDLLSAQEINSRISAAAGSQMKTQYYDLSAADITNKYITLNAAPIDENAVQVFVIGGSAQINKKALGAESGALAGNFEMDTITPERLYFGDVSATGSNDAHTFGSTAFDDTQFLMVVYEA